MDPIVAPLQSAAEILRDSRRPLLLIPEDPTTDVLAAALGLATALRVQRPEISIVSPNFSAHQPPEGLSDLHRIVGTLPNLRDFLVTINTNRTKLDSIRYEVLAQSVQIHLTPKTGLFEARDISTSTTPFFFDRIVTIGLRRLEDLGEIYQGQRDFFYHTPIVNIDDQADNGRFGHVNLVDVTAVSRSEIVADLTHQLFPDALTEPLATTLLTGIIAATKGFQSQLITPHTLTTAARLMAAGAKRDDIIRRLYHTKTVPILRLWGRALTNLQSASHDRLVWTAVSKTDLENQQAQASDVVGMADELLATTPNAIFAVALVETPPNVQVVVICRAGSAPTGLPPELHSGDGQKFVGQVGGSLASVEKQIIGTLRTALGE